jgi:hypothetical protein
MDYSKLPYYALFLFLFMIVNVLSTWGQYVTLPYKELTMWQAYKMAIPFVWLEWIILTFTISVGHTHDLFTPTQITFLLIIMQFASVLTINKYYLKKYIYISDLIAFFIVLLGFFVSFLHIVSKAFGIPIPEHPGYKDPDEASETTKSMRYRLSAKSSGDLGYSNLNTELKEK